MKTPKYQIPKNTEEANRQREALLEMLGTRGWQVYKSQLNEVREHELGKALEGRDQTLVFRALGAADAVGKMLEWPAKQTEALDEQLRAGDLPQNQT